MGSFFETLFKYNNYYNLYSVLKILWFLLEKFCRKREFEINGFNDVIFLWRRKSFWTLNGSWFGGD